MTILALNAGEITGIIGAVATVFTAFIVPTVKWMKKKRMQHEQRIENVLHSIDNRMEKVATLEENFNEFIEDYDAFTTQNYKYMINDAYFGYNNIHEIPDDVLTNACECCEIYVNKKHKNHEIRPRCELLWKEQERRAINREVHDEQ